MKKTPTTRHKMALITYAALVPLVYLIPDMVGHFLPSGKLLNVVVSVGIIVSIMSYVVMPLAQMVFLNRR
mgnify:FL=1